MRTSAGPLTAHPSPRAPQTRRPRAAPALVGRRRSSVVPTPPPRPSRRLDGCRQMLLPCCPSCEESEAEG